MYQLCFDNLVLSVIGKPAAVAITTKVQYCVMIDFFHISSVMLVKIFYNYNFVQTL